MELNKLQKDYVKKILYLNVGGSDTKILKSSIVTFAESHGLVFKKNITKGDLVDLIISSGLENELYDKFANQVDVPFWDVAKLNNLTYKQVSDLDQLGIIEALTYTGYKDSTLYPLSALGFDEGELEKIWLNKHKTDFYRTRIEINNIDDIPKIINELSKMFEIENLSKPYPHRENKDACYIYLSIRSLNGSITNDDYKNKENAKLKLEVSTLKETIKELNSTISDYKAKEYYSDAATVEKLKKKLWKIESDFPNAAKVEHLEKEIAELKEKLNNSSGGRPPKFTDQDKETMKMYRLQGKSIREIAKLFECSTGLVHKIINE